MAMTPLTARLYVKVSGRVQGIGFRWFVLQTAQQLAVRGWVRNLGSGEVEFEAQAKPETLKRFVDEVCTGHAYARIERVERRELPARGDETGFTIKR